MGTVIDSLLVQLKLDPADFKKGSKDIVDTSKKTVDEVVKGGKTIEESATKTADSISKITREVLGLYAVFVGARGIKEFIADLVGADAALGRFSRNLNTSPQTLYAWGAAAERVGGSSEATAATFERIGKALYDLHRNGQALPKEYSQLQALTGINIDREHGVDKFLQNTAAALQRLNQIDPSQVHFIAQGMGIDDATANVMIKYGNGIGAYIDQLKKLSPQNDAIKAAQELQNQWKTLQQTAIALANTVLQTLGPELSKLLGQMTDWVTKNQDWIQSGIVQGVKDFANYLRSIDWSAVGQGLKDFGNDAKAVADALGGVVRATEILVGLWAGGKVLSILGSLRSVTTGGGGAAAGTAAAGGIGLGSLAKIFGVAGAAYSLTDTAAAPDMKTIKKSDRSLWDMIFGRGGDASGHADALQNNPALGGASLGNGRDAALDAFLNGDTKVDGRPVSRTNPLPVVNADNRGGSLLDYLVDPNSTAGKIVNAVGGAIRSLFGGGNGSSGGDVGPLRAVGPSAGVRGWWSKSRQQHAYERLTKEAGLGDAGAKAMISRFMNVEASGGPGEVNSIGATGIAQMLGARKKRLYQMAASQGKPVSDFDLQLSHIIEELNGSERKAGDRLRSARTAADGATGASMYERAEGYNPLTGRDNFTGRTLGGMRGMDKLVGATMAGAALSAKLSTISNDNRVSSSSSNHQVSIGTMNVNAPNATNAQGIADRATDALYRSTVAATANYGPR